MVINTNISALNSARTLSESSANLSKAIERLSSGSKITSPEDDAAGLAVSTRFDGEINRIGAVKNNLGNSISFNQTQDGFLQKVSKALNRMSELAMLSQDVTKTDTDRLLYNQEFTKLSAYITDLSSKTFNGIPMFDGTIFNVTTDGDANTIATAGVNLAAGAYTTALASTIDNAGNANTALDNVKAAIDQIASDRAGIGANISVLSAYQDHLSVLKNNLSQANSRIKDVDVAEESTQYARYNILVQSGTAMLAQANQSTQGVLKLLQ